MLYRLYYEIDLTKTKAQLHKNILADVCLNLNVTANNVIVSFKSYFYLSYYILFFILVLYNSSLQRKSILKHQNCIIINFF